jgi:hypothetical protein
MDKKGSTMETESFIGESIDCFTLGEGTIIDVVNNTAKIYLEEFDQVIDLPLDEIEIEEEVQLDEGRPKKIRTPEEQKIHDAKVARRKPGGGRGRPAKKGSAAWERQQERTKSGNDLGSERKVVTAQLLKAKSIGAKVTFADGSSHSLEDHHINKYHDILAAARTPIQKAEIQKKADKSHKDWLEVVNSPPKQYTGGTSSIVNYR